MTTDCGACYGRGHIDYSNGARSTCERCKGAGVDPEAMTAAKQPRVTDADRARARDIMGRRGMSLEAGGTVWHTKFTEDQLTELIAELRAESERAMAEREAAIAEAVEQARREERGKAIDEAVAAIMCQVGVDPNTQAAYACVVGAARIPGAAPSPPEEKP